MPVEGIIRYKKLFQNVKNPYTYLYNKLIKKSWPLYFSTKPIPIQLKVTKGLYLVFKEIFMNDVYDIDELVKKLPANPLIIDIGANVGYFGVQLLSKIPNANILAYEPMPVNVKFYQEMIQQNESLKKSVSLFQMAVTGKKQDYVELFSDAEDQEQVVASVITGFNKQNTNCFKVPCISMTDIILNNGLSNIDLLKMDCEGSEFDIMYETDPILIKRINTMVIEVHDLDDEKKNVIAFSTYLRSLGYIVKHVPINSFCHALEAVRVK
jgi:FkbM family methyltransferase